jgi:hypothetical protein
MNMTPVSSSAIAAVGYDNGMLAVAFHNSGTYYHPGVPYSVFLGLLSADSIGSYYNHYIRGRYR